jgi:hypothetical protein
MVELLYQAGLVGLLCIKFFYNLTKQATLKRESFFLTLKTTPHLTDWLMQGILSEGEG